MAKMTKEEKKKLKEEKKAKGETLWQQFKKFITRGSILDLSVGVIMGGAFNAIVNAFTKILMSVCTWYVPGGINGLVTVLPAANEAQKGAYFILEEGKDAVQLQSFTTSELNEMTIAYARYNGIQDLTVDSTIFTDWKNSLIGLYDLHGGRYTYKMSAVIDWGTFINAIISFLVIALTLFIIVKVAQTVKQKRIEFNKKLEMKVEQLEK